MTKSCSLFLLVAYITLLASINCATSQYDMVYSIAKTVNDCTCCGPNCFTLSDFAANSSQLLHDNIYLIFAPGTHILTLKFTVSNKSILKMVSSSSSPHVQVVIECTQNSSFSFVNCISVNITGIKFVGCGNNEVRLVISFVLQNLTFEGRGDSGTVLELIESRAEIHGSAFKFNTGIRKVIHFRLCYNTLLGGALVAIYTAILLLCRVSFIRIKQQLEEQFT